MDKKNNCTDNYSPYLRVLRVEICHKCLQPGKLLPSREGSNSFRAYCTNPKCENFQKEWLIPYEVFTMLDYLTYHQPE